MRSFRVALSRERYSPLSYSPIKRTEVSQRLRPFPNRRALESTDPDGDTLSSALRCLKAAYVCVLVVTLAPFLRGQTYKVGSGSSEKPQSNTEQTPSPKKTSSSDK